MTTPPSPAAEAIDVSHRFGAALALDHVDLTVPPGVVTALLGPNGAGKTTLVRILLGLIPPTNGLARLWGQPPALPASRRRVGAMLQVGRVPDTLTVREHVHLFSSYYGTTALIDETLALAGVANVATRRFGHLSGGQRQRALFALAICGRPDLLVLDEPTVGLDVEARHAFWTGVAAMTARGCSVLLTSHYLDEVDAVAGRLVILNRGRVVESGTPQAIKRRLGAKRVRCTTSLGPGSVAAICGVRSVTQEGEAVVAVTTRAEALVRELLARDPGLSNLEVSGVRLEEAFLEVTGGADVRTVGA
jgi:ABC-2 type transport system ATP-binding protein